MNEHEHVPSRRVSRGALLVTTLSAAILLAILAAARLWPLERYANTGLVHWSWIVYLAASLYLFRRYALHGPVSGAFWLLPFFGSCSSFLVDDYVQSAEAQWQVDLARNELASVTELLEGMKRPPARLEPRVTGSIHRFDYCRGGTKTFVDVWQTEDLQRPAGPRYIKGTGWQPRPSRPRLENRNANGTFCTTFEVDAKGAHEKLPARGQPIDLFLADPELLAAYLDTDGDDDISDDELREMASLAGMRRPSDIPKIRASTDSDFDRRITRAELVEWLNDAVWPGRSPMERAFFPATRPRKAKNPKKKGPVLNANPVKVAPL